MTAWVKIEELDPEIDVDEKGDQATRIVKGKAYKTQYFFWVELLKYLLYLFIIVMWLFVL